MPAICTVLFFVQYIPIVLNVDHAYIRIHDTLEGELIWLHLLDSTKTLFSFSPDTQVEPLMNGVPRSVLPSGLQVTVWMVYLFGTYWGYWINHLIVHLVAYWGMIILIRTHFIRKDEKRFIAWPVALAFASLPFYTVFGISVAGLPLVFYAYLNLIIRRSHLRDYLILIAFPFYSSIVWAGSTLIPAMLVHQIFIFIFRKEQRSWDAPIGMTLMTGAYVFVNQGVLWLALLNPEFVPHRVEYNIFLVENIDWIKNSLESIYVFSLCHYHIATFGSLPILCAYLISLGYKGRGTVAYNLILSVSVISLGYGFYFYLVYIFQDIFPILISFKANRFIALLPTLWFLLMAVSLSRISNTLNGRTLTLFFVLIQFLTVLAGNDEFIQNIKQLTGSARKPNFREYMSESMFAEIRKDLGENTASYRVISVGISPTVAQYNGFYTLDGLVSIYSLDYKHRFRKIMETELDSSEQAKIYFDNWGNRCYYFSSELGIDNADFLIPANSGQKLRKLRVNLNEFKAMGGKYILSALPVENPENSGLTLLHKYHSTGSYWDIYVYRPLSI
jgi:hypothetical protein